MNLEDDVPNTAQVTNFEIHGLVIRIKFLDSGHCGWLDLFARLTMAVKAHRLQQNGFEVVNFPLRTLPNNFGCPLILRFDEFLHFVKDSKFEAVWVVCRVPYP